MDQSSCRWHPTCTPWHARRWRPLLPCSPPPHCPLPTPSVTASPLPTFLLSHCTLLLLITLSSGAVHLCAAVQGAMHVDPLYSAYHYSHPPLVDRLEAIDRALKKKK